MQAVSQLCVYASMECLCADTSLSTHGADEQHSIKQFWTAQVTSREGTRSICMKDDRPMSGTS